MAISTTMFDLYDPGELIGPAWQAGAEPYFRRGDAVRIASGTHVGQMGRVVATGSGPHPQGPLDYAWYEVLLSSRTTLYVAGWGWLHPVEN